MAGPVAVVTDSTACLPAEESAGLAIDVVPLRVVTDGQAFDDGPGALGAGPHRGARLSTASVPPAVFAAAYAAAAAAGAGAVVSVHLSGRLSGTVHSARLVADGSPVPVRVVDTGSIGMGLGIAALTAAEAAQGGAGPDDVAAAASARAARLRSFFVLDSLDQLSAGGRLPPGLPGAGLTARPLLCLAGGEIVLIEKVRTRSAAAARLEEAATGFAAGQRVDVAVQYLGAPERGAALAHRLERLIPGARRRYLTEASPVMLAHTGPGLLGVVVAPY